MKIKITALCQNCITHT